MNVDQARELLIQVTRIADATRGISVILAVAVVVFIISRNRQ